MVPWDRTTEPATQRRDNAIVILVIGEPTVRTRALLALGPCAPAMEVVALTARASASESTLCMCVCVYVCVCVCVCVCVIVRPGQGLIDGAHVWQCSVQRGGM